MTTLPTPTVVGCYFDIGFIPPLAAMQLRWEGGPGDTREWELPLGERIREPLPERFGLLVRRQDEDSYAVTMLWGATYRQWFSLRRREVEATSLGPILDALGTSLKYLLDQPVGEKGQGLSGAA
jgi:hypothetical protein